MVDLVVDWPTIEIINPLAILFLLLMLVCVLYSCISGITLIVNKLKDRASAA